VSLVCNQLNRWHKLKLNDAEINDALEEEVVAAEAGDDDDSVQDAAESGADVDSSKEKESMLDITTKDAGASASPSASGSTVQRVSNFVGRFTPSFRRQSSADTATGVPAPSNEQRQTSKYTPSFSSMKKMVFTSPAPSYTKTGVQSVSSSTSHTDESEFSYQDVVDASVNDGGSLRADSGAIEEVNTIFGTSFWSVLHEFSLYVTRSDM
jgi:hypothetical protein